MITKYLDEPNTLTSEEAKSSIKDGCNKKEMAKDFGVSMEIFNKLLSGKLKKIKIPRTSMWYNENENITDIRKAITDFVKCELSIGGYRKEIELALKNITRETLEDLFPKRSLKKK